jgi:hypothetical protein
VGEETIALLLPKGLAKEGVGKGEFMPYLKWNLAIIIPM